MKQTEHVRAVMRSVYETLNFMSSMATEINLCHYLHTALEVE